MNKCYIVFEEYFEDGSKLDCSSVIKVFSNRNSAIDFANKCQEESYSEFITFFYEEHLLHD